MTRRRIYGAALAATLAVGTASRAFQTGSVLSDKYLGDALYAVAIYLVLAVVAPERPTAVRAAITTVAVVAVECFQLTGWPAEWRDDPSIIWRTLSVALGTKFGWRDMAAYFVGIAAIWALDVAAIGAEGTKPPLRE